jgi:phage FluMu protein Com
VTERKDRPERREVRCWQCKKLLAKVTPQAIRADHDVEIKCSACNAMNYLRGYDEAA